MVQADYVPKNRSFVTVTPSAQEPRIYVLTLNRPKANALSREFVEEIRSAIDEVENRFRQYRDVSALIICSAIKNIFCAGADLKERNTMSNPEVTAFLERLGDTILKLESLPVPTFAAIDGVALGGGLELSLGCDFRVVGNSVEKIGFPETRLGIIPGAGGTYRARKLIGLAASKFLIYSGTSLNAEAAKEIGLVENIAEPGKTAFELALQLASEMTSSAPLAIEAAKSSLSELHLSEEAAYNFERECYKTLLDTKDRHEALSAFVEHRKPVFQGM